MKKVSTSAVGIDCYGTEAKSFTGVRLEIEPSFNQLSCSCNKNKLRKAENGTLLDVNKTVTPRSNHRGWL